MKFFTFFEKNFLYSVYEHETGQRPIQNACAIAEASEETHQAAKKKQNTQRAKT
jgi:hypothetical protein